MHKIVLYSTHCPMCIFLEQKLKEKNINYTEVNDVEKIKELGFSSVPILEVDGNFMGTKDAFKFLNNI